jgi:hypothetical protein
VTIPDNVTTIGDFAFSGTGLSSITIPRSVTNIGSVPFQACTNLTNILVDLLNPAYRSVGGVLFDKSQATLINYPAGDVGSYSIPNSVTSIGFEAFTYSTRLTSLTVPDNVTSIGDSAFNGCFSLTNVAMGNSITNIERFAFGGCKSLTSVTIPKSVTSIGLRAFEDCDNLARVYFQGNAPSGNSSVFSCNCNDFNATAYYLPGTSGWGSTFGGIPTALWILPYPLLLNSSLGVQSNQFAFTVSWATNLSVVVEEESRVVTRDHQRP